MTKVIPNNEQAETFPTTCYLWRGIVYVPHYKKLGEYVGPGYGNKHMNTYGKDFLLGIGASAITEMLWKRAEGNVIE